MSREVEERVVQMTFENGQFESAAKQSLATVERIKSETDLSKTAQAIAKSGMVEAVQRIEGAFTSFGGILRRKIFDQLADQVISSAKRLFNEIEIQPIQQGFDEYELKMGSVQTIMNSTGESLNTVNRYLDQLNTYADRTIYSFSDMTSNIGKFTNSGVKLDDAVKAIQGISNEAALSGANANEASRAMYNFAQALSSGAVRLIDWKSIENANMATVEFKEQLIQTAEELGTLKKTSTSAWKTVGKKNAEAFNATSRFNDSLQEQWLTSEVLIQTLAKYSDETTDLGQRAYAAAQDVKTFTQLIDTLKEASGSGWAETWQIIFGDFEEAKQLWTSVSNVIGDLISKQSESRNAMLQQWKDLGGRTLAIQGLADAFEVLRGFVSAAVRGFQEFFPALTGEKLFSWTQKFSDFMAALKEALPFIDETTVTVTQDGMKVNRTIKKHFKFSGVLEKVYRIFSGLGAAASIAAKGISTLGGLFFDLIKFSLPGGEGILGWLASIGDRLGAVRQEMEDTDFFGTWRKRIEASMGPVGEKAKQLGNNFLSLFGSIHTWFVNSGYKERFLAGLERFASDFADAVPVVLSAIFDFSNGVVDYVQHNEKIQAAIGKLKDLIDYVVQKAPDLYNKVTDFVKGIWTFGDGAESLKDKFSGLAGTVRDFLKELFGLDEDGASILDDFVKDLFPGFAKASAESESEIVNPVEEASSNVNKAVESVKTAFHNIGEAVRSGLSWIQDTWKTYNLSAVVDKIFYLWSGTRLVNLVSSFTKLNKSLANGFGGFGDILKAVTRNIDKSGDGVKGVFDSIADIFKNFWDKMTGVNKDWTDMFRKKDTPATAILKIAGAIAILVAAVYILSKMDMNSFIDAGKKLGILAGGLLVFSLLFNQITKNAAIKDLGKQLKSLSASLLIMTAAMFIIGHMNVDTIIKGLAGIGLVLLELGIFFKMTKDATVFGKNQSLKLISLAFSLILLLVPLEILGHTKWAKMLQGILGLGLVLTEIALFLKLTKDVASFGVGQSLKLVSLAFAITLLMVPLTQLSKMKFAQMLQGIAGLGLVLAELGIFTRLVAKLPKGTKLASFAGLALALLGVMRVVKEIGDMEPDKLVVGIAGLGILLTELGIFSRLASKQFKFSTGFAFMGLAVALGGMVVAMKAIAKMRAGDIAKGIGIMALLFGMIAITTRAMGEGVGILKSIGTLILVVGILSMFFLALGGLRDYPADQLKAIAGTFGIIMAAIGVMLAGAGAFSKGGAAKGLSSLTLVVGLILAIGSVLAAINEATNGLVSQALNDSKEMLTELGEAIGAFFGGIIGGGVGALMSSMPQIGTDMSSFMNNAKDFFEGCKSITSEVVSGGLGIAGILAALAGADVLEAIAKFIGFGESSMATFGTDIKALGEGMAAFAKSTDGIVDDDFERAVKGAEMLADVNKALPKTGGKLQEWLGWQNLDSFSEDIKKLGKGIYWFNWWTKDVNGDKVASVGSGAQVLAQLNKDLPPTGGKLQKWLGEANLQTFASGLSALGLGIAEFSSALTSTEQSDIDKATGAAAILGGFAQSLPEVSIFDLLTGTDFANFNTELPNLGTAIGSFAKNLRDSGVSTGDIRIATSAAKILATFTETIPDNSILENLFGMSDLRSFGVGIGYLGWGIGQFVANTQKVDPTAVQTAADAAAILAAFADTDLKGRTFGQVMAQFMTGQSELENFGSGMAAFGSGLGSLYQAAMQVQDWSVVTTAIENLQAVADMVKDMSEGSWTSFQFSGDAFADWDSSGLREFLEGLSDFGDVPNQVGMSFSDGIKEGLMEGLLTVPASLGETWNTIATELINAASHTGYAMYQMGITIGNNLVSGLRYPDFYGAGQDAGSGFISGVRSKASSAYSAGASLGSAALSGTRTALKSHSPSKEFELLGSYSGEGFANGLDKWNYRIQDAGASLGNSALIGAQTTLEYLYSVINSSMDMQPVIRPVVDTTGITTGAAQIGGILSGTSMPIRGFMATQPPAMASLSGIDSVAVLARSNQNVVDAVTSLGSRIDSLGNKIANLQMVTDTGVLAGEMQDRIDRNLGVIAIRKGGRK